MAITPILYYPDVAPVLDFYLHLLGFETSWLNADDISGQPLSAGVDFEGNTLLLMKLADPEVGTPLGAGVVLHVEMSGNIDGLYTRLREAGVEIVEPLAEQLWGQRTFTINDPAGYALTFGQPIPA